MIFLISGYKLPGHLFSEHLVSFHFDPSAGGGESTVSAAVLHAETKHLAQA